MLTLIAIAKLLGTANVAKKIICEEPVHPLSAQHAAENIATFVGDKLGSNDSDCNEGVVDSVVDSASDGSIFDIFDIF